MILFNYLRDSYLLKNMEFKISGHEDRGEPFCCNKYITREKR